MSKELKDQIIGSIVLLIFVAIPLGFILTPAITIAFVVGAIWGIVRDSEKQNVSRGTKVQPKNTKLSQQDEELITAILPDINSKN